MIEDVGIDQVGERRLSLGNVAGSRGNRVPHRIDGRDFGGSERAHRMVSIGKCRYRTCRAPKPTLSAQKGSFAWHGPLMVTQIWCRDKKSRVARLNAGSPVARM